MPTRSESTLPTLRPVDVRSTGTVPAPGVEQRVLRAAMATADGWWEWELATEQAWYSDDFAHLLGYLPGELDPEASTFANLVHPGDLKRVMGEIDGHIVGGPPFNVQFRIRRKSGDYRWVRSRGRCTYDDRGTPQLLSGSLQDIESHKLAAQQGNSQAQIVARQERMNSLNTMAAGVAHEFNNLLQVMQGYVQCAARQVEMGQRPTRDLVQTQGVIDRAIELNREFLAFCRTGERVSSTFDLNRTLQALADRLRPVLPPGITLSIRGSAEPLVVEVDEAALHEALLNLATNARDAMTSRGELTVRCAPLEVTTYNSFLFPELDCGEYACLTITDTGQGIDPESVHRVWEPFFTTKPPHLGSGLGLAQVYGFAQHHQGAVGLHSEPGRGTTFRVYLPLAKPLRQPWLTADLTSWQDAPALLLTSDPLLARGARNIVEACGGSLVPLDSPELLIAALADHQGRVSWALVDWDESELGDSQLARCLSDLKVAKFTGFDSTSSLPLLKSSLAASGQIVTALEKPFDARSLLEPLTTFEAPRESESFD